MTYSILNAQTDTQFVRVYLNYDPPGFDPNTVTTEQDDTTAQVIVSGAGETFSFHDTLITPLDLSRFHILHAFVSSLFRPQPSVEYTLTVVSPKYGTVTSTSRIPGRGMIIFYDESRLLYPEQYPEGAIEINVTLDSGTKGFIMRFVIVSAQENDATFTAETEVPSTYYQNSSGTWVPAFGTLSLATSQHTIVSFAVRYYQQVLDNIIATYGAKVHTKQVKFYLIQLDAGLYNYYSVANGFQDMYSIRTDQPDYTNIKNGLGVFGSFNVDTLSVNF